MGALGQDVRHAFRIFRRAPLFYAGLLATLALGIGANGAVFGILQAVLLQPLPYDHPDEVVMVWRARADAPAGQRGLLTPEMARDWREQSKDVFTGVAAIRSWAGSADAQFDLVLGDRAERLRGALATPDFFDLLGVRAARGRLFGPGDEQSAERPVVLTDGLWRRAFGGDPAIVGRSITLVAGVRPRGPRGFTVIGILPPAFRFTYPQETEVWTLQSRAEPGGGICCHAVARLKPGVSFASASARMAAIRSHLDSARIERMHDWVVGETRPSLLLLAGVACLLLAMACATVANALLVRMAERRQELAVRGSLGADRARLVRQLLTEGVVLSTAGALAGTLAAAAIAPAVRRLVPAAVPRADEIAVNGSMLLFGIAAAGLTTILAALAPAWRGAGVDVAAALKAASGDRVTARWRQALVGVQVAVATVLLVAAALLITSFRRLGQVPLGFDGSQVLTVEMRMLDQRYQGTWLSDTAFVQSGALTAFRKDLVQRVAAVPGVLDAGLTSAVPFRGTDFRPVLHAVGQTRTVAGNGRFVDAGFFRVMRIPLLRGRLFSANDTAASPRVALVSESYAREMFGTEDAVGRQIDHDGPTGVVGVVGDVRYVALDRDPQPAVYFPAAQGPSLVVCLVARTAPDGGDVGSAIRRVVHDLDPALPAMQMTTIDRIVDDSIANRRFYTTATGAFAGLALALTIAGLVVIVARSVVERRRELAIRSALGATAARMVRLVMGRALLPVAAGAAAGLAGAYAGSSLLDRFLFEIGPREPAIYAAAASLIVFVAAMAALAPARRAAAIAPAQVLRGA
jgi:putative ABC transport system permease protein